MAKKHGKKQTPPSKKMINKTEQRNSIRIALVGCVSSGKSTLLNSICVNQYEDMKRKRTTMLPSVYKGSNMNIYNNKSEVSRIQAKNKEIYDKIYSTEAEVTLTNETCSLQEHIIPMIKGFVDFPDNVFIDIYDIPGLNDAKTKEVYFTWIRDNFHKFDIIINVVDINTALNTSDETDIINLISDCIQKEKVEHSRDVFFLTAINKCDDMDMNNGIPVLVDEEELELYEQIVSTTKNTLTSKNIDTYGFAPITSRDTYIYRMLHNDPTVELDMSLLNQFGLNEIGKTKWNRMSTEKKRQFINEYFKDLDQDDIESTLELTGFANFRDKISNYLTNEKQSIILTSRIRCELSSESICSKNITKNTDEMKQLISLYNDYCIKVNTIDHIYGTNNSHLVTDLICNHMNRWVNDISDLSNDKEESIQRLEEYKEIMSMLQRTIDTYALKNKVKITIPDGKSQRWIDSLGIPFMKKDPNLTQTTLSRFIGSLYRGYSQLQNDYYKTQLQDYKNLENFPTNIFTIIDKMKDNRCDNVEELLDMVIVKIQNGIKPGSNDYGNLTSFENGPLSGYIAGKGGCIKVFCEKLLDSYDYPSEKVHSFLKTYLLNIYPVYKDDGSLNIRFAVTDILKHNLQKAYFILLDEYLSEGGGIVCMNDPYFRNLKIINKSHMCRCVDCLDTSIDYIEHESTVLCLPIYLTELQNRVEMTVTTEEEEEKEEGEGKEEKVGFGTSWGF